MLRCDKCDYDLKGLAKSSVPIRCPECGQLTDHNNGEPLPMIAPDHRWLRATYLPPVIAGVLFAGVLVVGSTGSGKWVFDFASGFVALGLLGSPLVTLILLIDWNARRDRRVRGSALKLWVLGLVHSVLVGVLMFVVIMGVVAVITLGR